MTTNGRAATPDRPPNGPPTNWLDPREQAAWRGYLRMRTLLNAHLNRTLIAATGLSDGDYAVLVNLSEADDSRMRAFALAREMQWEKSRLSHQLTRMEGRGLIRREECPSDARGAFIVLTDTGQATISAAAPRHVDEVRRCFIDVLTADQLDALAGIVDAVVGNLTSADECSDPATDACAG